MPKHFQRFGPAIALLTVCLSSAQVPGTGRVQWYFTAVDFHTGQAVYKVLAGTGVLYNSNYSSVYVGPDGKTAYVGVLGELVRIHDTY